MPERSTVAQVSQIGPEVTPGTAVAPTRRLGSVNISPSPNVEAEAFRPTGSKYPTVVTLNREWSDVALDGTPTYEELIYPAAMAMGSPVVSQVMDGATQTGAYEWVFTPSTDTQDNMKTFTLEQGQVGTQTERFSHLILAAFGLEISRSEVSFSGSGFAKAAETNFTTASATFPLPTSLTPVQPGHWSAYKAATSAGLSVPANKMARLISANPSIEDKAVPAWFVNQAEQSFTTWVENGDGVSTSLGMTVEADAAGMADVTTLRNGTTLFIRLEALGPVLYNAGTKPNLRAMVQWDFAVKVLNVEGWSDEDGIYAIPYTFQPVHDATWGQSQRLTIRNKVAAL